MDQGKLDAQLVCNGGHTVKIVEDKSEA